MKKLVIVCMVAGLFLAGCSSVKQKESMSKDMMSSSKMEDKENMGKSEDMKMMNEGEMAADFTLKDLDGNTFHLSEQKGKKIYLKFWASWCPICLATLKEVDELSKMDTDFEVLTVVSPNQLGEMDTESFKKWFSGLEYKNVKVLLDEEGSFVKAYNIRSTPTNILIGTDGVLVKQLSGPLSNDVLKEIFQEIK